MGQPIKGTADRSCPKCGRVTPHEIMMDKAPTCLRCREIDAGVDAELRRREVAQRVAAADRARDEARRPQEIYENTRREAINMTIGAVIVGLAVIAWLVWYLATGDRLLID